MTCLDCLEQLWVGQFFLLDLLHQPIELGSEDKRIKLVLELIREAAEEVIVEPDKVVKGTHWIVKTVLYLNY